MTTSNQKTKKHPNQKQLWQIWNNEKMIWKGGPKPESVFSYIDSISLLLIVFVITLIPNLYKFIRRINTAYAFNEKGVYFKLWRWGDARLHFIDFKDIEQISFVEYEGGKGTIRLISQKDFFFQTPSFEFSKTNTHPTLEKIDNGVEVYRRMKEHRQMRIATQKTTQ